MDGANVVCDPLVAVYRECQDEEDELLGRTEWKKYAKSACLLLCVCCCVSVCLSIFHFARFVIVCVRFFFLLYSPTISHFCRNTQNPNFDKVLDLDPLTLEYSNLKFVVYDMDPNKTDVVMGSAVLSFNDLMANPVASIPVRNDNNSALNRSLEESDSRLLLNFAMEFAVETQEAQGQEFSTVQLQADLTRLERMNEALNGFMVSSSEETVAHKHRYAELRVSLLASETEKAGFRQLLSEREAELAKLKNDLEKMKQSKKDEIAKLQEKIHGLEAECKKLRGLLKEADAMIAEYREKLRAARQDLFNVKKMSMRDIVDAYHCFGFEDPLQHTQSDNTDSDQKQEKKTVMLGLGCRSLSYITTYITQHHNITTLIT